MERIAGINEVRPKLTSFIESLKNDPPVVITINSEPKAVLLDYTRVGDRRVPLPPLLQR
ncbi:hypothetisches protein [Moorella thermoacetica]|uniref:Hypothetisches protein n=1 Tax=Neomoorella thermoacetica TaxID=1525 RepID=A0A1J5P2A4_NEOTH|nr:hypothetisches protein [Moorella thermoacetica]